MRLLIGLRSGLRNHISVTKSLVGSGGPRVFSDIARLRVNHVLLDVGTLSISVSSGCGAKCAWTSGLKVSSNTWG